MKKCIMFEKMILDFIYKKNLSKFFNFVILKYLKNGKKFFCRRMIILNSIIKKISKILLCKIYFIKIYKYKRK